MGHSFGDIAISKCRIKKGRTMETKIQRIDRSTLVAEDLREAAVCLQGGGLVAFPTETVYGLGGNALDETAAARIYAAKGRPSDNPLIVHIADLEALTELASEVPEAAYALAKAFWPGPLTMILKKSEKVPYGTTGGLETVGIRMPSDEIAAMLIREAGLYIAAPSANASGRPSTTKAEHVIEDLNGKIDMILDGGASTIGLESTIVDLTGETPLILRPGYITREQIEAILGAAEYDRAVLERKKNTTVVAKAPGMKYKHYAPKAELQSIEGVEEKVIAYINAAAKKAEADGTQVGILAAEETKHCYETGLVKSIGSRKKEEEITAHLFATLREFDETGVELIFSEGFSDSRLGQAIMNRLLKAAGYQIMEV